MKDGRTLTEYVAVALGEPRNPLTRNGLIAKFMEQVEFSQLVTINNAERLVELVEGLESVNNVAQIFELAVRR